MSEQNDILNSLLDMGEALLYCGAEISRVEDTLQRMGKAYGARHVNVFAITSSIVVTTDLGGKNRTQSRRIHPYGGTDFSRLEDLNALSRRCCGTPLSAEELKTEMRSIMKKKTPQWKRWIGYPLAAGAFAVFFGGGWLEGLFAALLGLLIMAAERWASPYFPNRVFFNLLVSFAAGMAAQAFTLVLPSIQTDKVLIGDIMLLIPGIAITNAIRDVMAGDTISGLIRLIESLLYALALGVGFAAALWIGGLI